MAAMERPWGGRAWVCAAANRTPPRSAPTAFMQKSSREGEEREANMKRHFTKRYFE